MTAAKPKRGRPPLAESERATWEARLRMTPAEGLAIERAAEAESLEVGVWLRERIRRSLRRSR